MWNLPIGLEVLEQYLRYLPPYNESAGIKADTIIGNLIRSYVICYQRKLDFIGNNEGFNTVAAAMNFDGSIKLRSVKERRGIVEIYVRQPDGTYESVQTIEDFISKEITSLAISPNSEYLFCAFDYKCIGICRRQSDGTYRLIEIIVEVESSIICSLSTTADAGYLASARSDGKLKIYVRQSDGTYRLNQSFNELFLYPRTGKIRLMTLVSISPDSNNLIVVDYFKDGTYKDRVCRKQKDGFYRLLTSNENCTISSFYTFAYDNMFFHAQLVPEKPSVMQLLIICYLKIHLLRNSRRLDYRKIFGEEGGWIWNSVMPTSVLSVIISRVILPDFCC